MFFLLIALLPVITSFAGTALIDVYSETPKIILLEGCKILTFFLYSAFTGATDQFWPY
jgi:uncharacterized membrane protein